MKGTKSQKNNTSPHPKFQPHNATTKGGIMIQVFFFFSPNFQFKKIKNWANFGKKNLIENTQI
jgi:hypothetical protein